MTLTPPRKSRLPWKAQYRTIPTRHPPVDLFERTDLSEREKRAVFHAQRRINPRLRQALGDVQLVRDGDMVHGPNASIVLAPFTHIGFPTRFSDGAFGVYYAARTLETSIRETVYHAEREARLARLAPEQFQRRVFVGTIRKTFYDVRADKYRALHRPDDYAPSQGFARDLRAHDPEAWGIVYNSVRHKGGHCIAALRPPAVSLPTQGPLLLYAWDGRRITHVYERSEPIVTF